MKNKVPKDVVYVPDWIRVTGGMTRAYLRLRTAEADLDRLGLHGHSARVADAKERIELAKGEILRGVLHQLRRRPRT